MARVIYIRPERPLVAMKYMFLLTAPRFGRGTAGDGRCGMRQDGAGAATTQMVPRMGIRSTLSCEKNFVKALGFKVVI